jgi:hypothetical protein
MLHRKPYIEKHLQSAQKRMAARLELLTTNGVDAAQIKKDTQIKHFNAQVRKAKRELSAIAAIENLVAEKNESRLRKEAAAKEEALQPPPKKRDLNAQPAKKKKQRHVEAEEED